MTAKTNGHHVVDDLVSHARVQLQEASDLPSDRDRQQEYIANVARSVVRTYQTKRVHDGEALVSEGDKQKLTQDVINRLQGGSRLYAMLDDSTIKDIWAQGFDQVFVHRTGGRIEQAEPFVTSDEELIALIQSMAAEAGIGAQERRFDRAEPVLDLQLPGGERLHAMRDLCKRPSVSIRCHRLLRATLTDLYQRDMFSTEVFSFLQAAITARLNIVISGKTGVGKTTLLRSLCALLPNFERLISIEDVWELALDDIQDNVVALQARQPNIEGAGGISVADLFRSGLRMNPSRVIVGEVRGDEAIVLLHAMNQGNDGSLSTIHASSSASVFTKLQTFGASAPEKLNAAAMAHSIADAVNLVIHLAQSPNGTYVISSIREVVGSDGERVQSNELYRPDTDRKAQPASPPSRDLTQALTDAGWTHPHYQRGL